MLPRWLAGIWLGKRFSSDESIVATQRGVVVRATGVRSVSDDPHQLFDHVLLDEIKGCPWSADGKGEEDVEVIRLLPLLVPETPRGRAHAMALGR
eukprot:4895908-Amphidinium_carterae.4